MGTLQEEYKNKDAWLNETKAKLNNACELKQTFRIDVMHLDGNVLTTNALPNYQN